MFEREGREKIEADGQGNAAAPIVDGGGFRLPSFANVAIAPRRDGPSPRGRQSLLALLREPRGASLVVKNPYSRKPARENGRWPALSIGRTPPPQELGLIDLTARCSTASAPDRSRASVAGSDDGPFLVRIG